MVIVGCGVVGLWTARRLLDDGFCTADQLILLDRQQGVGGLWSAFDTGFANSSARVQTLEPMMRFMEPPPGRPPWQEFTPRDAVIEQMDHLIDTYGLRDAIRLGVEVLRVWDDEDGTPRVECERITDGARETIRASWVILAPGGLVEQREITFPGESDFTQAGGTLIYGQGATVDQLPPDAWEGKEIVCLGMGAQSVENARTALLRGAEKVHILSRRANFVASALLVYLLFISEDTVQPVSEQRKARQANREAFEASRHEACQRGGDLDYMYSLGTVQVRTPRCMLLQTVHARWHDCGRFPAASPAADTSATDRVRPGAHLDGGGGGGRPALRASAERERRARRQSNRL